ncbi:hypothetical protein [Seohaeicola zhoushanensis]|uniref:DUF1858 domain-containing protein n=1 Tax=Seohaeicola zhoushanensis TaxID=1569283 RepID=A0A8J3M875_9RHOB|nr:hypothetical protein [Seohaeicola zhoushanensis]GHF57318.1 hypothetical protein GCM10017056_30950 [Seohaeicola zhoushanensis]
MAEMDIDDLDLTLAEIFRRWPWMVRVFLDHQTHCPMCPIAPYHTIIDLCAEYHLDETAFRGELRRLLEERDPRTRR